MKVKDGDLRSDPQRQVGKSLERVSRTTKAKQPCCGSLEAGTGKSGWTGQRENTSHVEWEGRCRHPDNLLVFLGKQDSTTGLL